MPTKPDDDYLQDDDGAWTRESAFWDGYDQCARETPPIEGTPAAYAKLQAALHTFTFGWWTEHGWVPYEIRHNWRMNQPCRNCLAEPCDCGCPTCGLARSEAP